MELDVLVLAAGFGTRLRPLTLQVPKPLLPICGTPLLDHHLQRLLGQTPAAPSAGTPIVRRVVVNGHHLADRLAAHLATHAHRERLHFSHEPEILGTGGAIAHAAAHLQSDPIAIINCDALYDAPLAAAVSYHCQHRFAATMILLRASRWARVLAEEGRVVGILRGQRRPEAWCFTGCHLLSQEVMYTLPRGSFHDIIATYSDLISAGRLGAYIPPSAPETFLDVGTPADYLTAHLRCGGAAFERGGAIDPGAEIGSGARIRASVIFPRAHVAAGARLTYCIVGPRATAQGDLRGRLITTLGEREIVWPPNGEARDGP